MMVQEIKQWMKLIKDQRERLLFYEQKLAETGSYMFTDPDLSPAVYDPMVMIPENPEDRTLEKIIALDREIDANRAENQKKSQKVRKKVDNWVDHAIFHESHEQRLEKKRDSFYKKLSELAEEDGFHFRAEDLEDCIGEKVDVIRAEYPDAEPSEVFVRLLNDYTEEHV